MFYAREQTGRIMYYTYCFILRIVLYYVLSESPTPRLVLSCLRPCAERDRARTGASLQLDAPHLGWNG